MFSTNHFNRAGLRWFLIALLIFNLIFLARICSAQGFVGASLDSIAPTRTLYTYVFSGQITCQNRPCANARVDIDLVTTTQGAIAQSTRTGDDGRYQLEISVAGAPEDSSLWKLEAHSGLSTRESAQAEGRVILMDDEKTVVVDRSLLLTQA